MQIHIPDYARMNILLRAEQQTDMSTRQAIQDIKTFGNINGRRPNDREAAEYLEKLRNHLPEARATLESQEHDNDEDEEDER